MRFQLIGALAAPRASVRLLSTITYADCAEGLLRAVDAEEWTGEIVNLGLAR